MFTATYIAYYYIRMSRIRLRFVSLYRNIDRKIIFKIRVDNSNRYFCQFSLNHQLFQESELVTWYAKQGFLVEMDNEFSRVSPFTSSSYVFSNKILILSIECLLQY